MKWLVLVIAMTLAACQGAKPLSPSESTTPATQPDEVSQTKRIPKYFDGQRATLTDGSDVTILQHTCVDKSNCKYRVYFRSDSAAAAREGREIKNKWVEESMIREVVPIFSVGDDVEFQSDMTLKGKVTSVFFTSGRYRYALNYLDKNGVHRTTIAEEFELGFR